jgi:hypothetical protein
VKTDRLIYLSEMMATGAGIAVFLVVYLIGFLQAGPLLTLLAAWLPAAVFGWLAALAVRQGASMLLHFEPIERSIASLAEGAQLQPVALRDVRRRATHRASRERDWR